MSTGPTTDIDPVGGVSPELVLVDAVLGRRERALLPAPPDVFARGAPPVDEVAVGSGSVAPEAAECSSEPRPGALPPPLATDADPATGEPPSPPHPSLFPAPFPDDGLLAVQQEELAEARWRLMAGALDSETWGSGVLSKRRYPRPVTFVLTSSAAVAVEVLLLHLYLGWSGV